jgi:single-stranded-DNA-specific exonuclease
VEIILPKENREVLEAVKGNKLYASILCNRGIDTKQKVEAFKKIRKVDMARDMKDMAKAVERIERAITKQEKITVWGDMDCDGATSTVILIKGLAKIGADCDYHLPDRINDGYGMDSKNIDILAAQGTKLILTCDCGISNRKEIDYAKNYGIDVIVTDHHSLPYTLPAAYAIINPKLLPESHPAYNVSGAVVAYYLVKELYKKYGNPGQEKEFNDLVALSIIGDCVSLLDENRALLKKNFSDLINTERKGLKAIMAPLFSNCEKENVTEEDIAFQVVPKINAAGRIEHIKLAVKTLLAEEEKIAEKLAEKLEILNTERKQIQALIVKEAEEKIEKEIKNMRTIQLYNKDWHQGIVGIVAGRLAEKHGKPTIILTKNGDKITGSARSGGTINLIECLNDCKEYLLKCGGHKAAAGLSLAPENLKAFARAFENRVRKEPQTEEKLLVDGVLNLHEITEKLYNEIRLLAPYGQDFPKPIFYTEKVRIKSIKPFAAGSDLTFEKNGKYVRGTYYEPLEESMEGKVVNIAYTLQKSSWGNNIYINPIVEKMFPAA